MANPIKFTKLNSSQEQQLAQNVGLTSYLRKLASGSDPTPRSWLYETRSPEWIKEQVEKLIDLNKASHNIITEQDQSKWSKFGPQGGLPPFKERLETFQEYYEYVGRDYSTVFNSDIWKQAITETIHDLKFKPVNRPLAPKNVIKRAGSKDNLNTNSGWPLFTKRKKTEVQQEALEAVANGTWKEYPAILGSRSSRGKARFIFMFPFATNVHEATFQIPLQDHIRGLNHPFFSAWEGFSRVELNMTEMFQKFSHFTGTDFSGMDMHFTLQHSLQAFEVVKHFFQKGFWHELKESIMHANTIHVLTSDGIVKEEHGLSSGSGWTNFLETIFLYVLFKYISLRYGVKMLSMGLGDDGEIAADLAMNEKFVEASNSVGLDSNLEKQVSSDVYTHYLQRIFVRDYYSRNNPKILGGVYPLSLATNSLIYPERFHDPKKWDGRMFAIRNIMILENTVNHPSFEEFVRFIYSGSDHMKEFARLSSKEVASAEAQARGINGLIPTYNQEKENKTLEQFEALKIMRQLAK